MLYFLEKAEKIAATLWAPPPNPVDLRRLGDLPSDYEVVTPEMTFIYIDIMAK